MTSKPLWEQHQDSLRTEALRQRHERIGRLVCERLAHLRSMGFDGHSAGDEDAEYSILERILKEVDS